MYNEKPREWGDYYKYHRLRGTLQSQTRFECLIEKPRADVSQRSQTLQPTPPIAFDTCVVAIDYWVRPKLDKSEQTRIELACSPLNKSTSAINEKNSLMTFKPEASESSLQRDLAARIRAGDALAEDEFVKFYSAGLMAILRWRTSDIQKAEDAHQEAFRIVLQRLRDKGIDDPAKLSRFLHRTAINVLIAETRKESRHKTTVDTSLVQNFEDSSPGQLAQLLRDESATAIRNAIQDLATERDREILYRFYILQQEKPNICQAMVLSTEHFDRVISRARKRFRQVLEDRHLGIGSD